MSLDGRALLSFVRSTREGESRPGPGPVLVGELDEEGHRPVKGATR
jgi:hypothetical protein